MSSKLRNVWLSQMRNDCPEKNCGDFTVMNLIGSQYNIYSIYNYIVYHVISGNISPSKSDIVNGLNILLLFFIFLFFIKLYLILCKIFNK